MLDINSAIEFAAQKHEDKVRKINKWPYIVHLYDVVQILMEDGADEETIIAGILHDTVEDTNTTLEEIEEIFGHRIAQIIDFESEKKLDESGNKLPYRTRRIEHMERIAKAPKKVKMVNCADKLSNIKSMYLDCKYVGEEYFFSKFNGTKADNKWYYGMAVDALSDLQGLKMYTELKFYYNKFFGQNHNFEDNK